MAACGCRPGRPASFCPEGRRLLESETRAMRVRVGMLARSQGDVDRLAAVERLRDARNALLAHLDGEAPAEDPYEAAERAALREGA